MSKYIGSIITDCSDPNTRGRQETAFKTLFDGASPTFIGVDAGSLAPGLEAGGILVDQLDVLNSFPTTEGQQNIILVNAAWRGSKTREQYDNGVPFCFFRPDEKTLVASTFGDCLSLVRQQGIVSEVQIVDMPTVLARAVKWGELSPEQAEKISNTQFRSLEFLPRLARWLIEGRDVPSETQSLDALPNPDRAVWSVDNFGNGKTNLLPTDVDFKDGKRIELADASMAVCHTRLTDVPTGETALTIGSSGYGGNHWLELVIGGGNAAKKYRFTVGSLVLQGRVA